MTNSPDQIVLVYTAEDGTTYEQPLADLAEAGTLIDPEIGDDLELAGWRFADGDDYVCVDGGLVQNDPALPVFDLDILESDSVDQYTLDEVADLHARICLHPTARARLAGVLDKAEEIVAANGCPEELLDMKALRQTAERTHGKTQA